MTTTDEEFEVYKERMDAEAERFSVDTSVIWKGGEERGAFVNFGKITELKGKPYSGTLVCTFSSNKGTTVEEFNKSDGKCINGNGFIRLMI